MVSRSRRDLLRAVGTAAGAGLAGCTGTLGGDEETPDCPPIEGEPNYGDWFEGVGTYRGTCDLRGESEVGVQVGAHGGLGFYRFAPTAIAVSPDTRVVWEWTGKGGPHNVVAESDAFDSGDPVDSGEATFEYVFETPGLYRYTCVPHREMGMRGAVYVTVG